VEDGGKDILVENNGDDSHLSPAPGTGERIAFQDPLKEFCPPLSHRLQGQPIGWVITGSGNDLCRRTGVGEAAFSSPTEFEAR
jgi:hypothetical protein